MIITEGTGSITHVVGIDPGVTTGFCAVRLGGGSTLKARVLSGQVFTAELAVGSIGAGMPLFAKEARLQVSVVNKLARLAEMWGVQDCFYLAIEDFIIRERSKDRSLLSPVRMTSGVLALLEQMEDLKVVVHLNSAADAKSVIQDKTLTSHGLYRRGLPHATDAARHALHVLRKELT